jgi:2-keto-4-pentenoate hydratase
MLADYDARTPGLLFDDPPDLTIDQAYALQAQIARLREARGEKVIGYKLGCTSPTLQAQLGIHEPIFAPLFDTERHDSGARLSHARFANLAVEGELAVTLADPDAIESIFPVIELHHYVLRSPSLRCQELIAVNGMHAGFVVADPPHGGPQVRVKNLTLVVNDERIGRSDEPWTMATPIASVRWLAARLADRGLRLWRGQVILTGSSLPLIPVAPGTRVVVEAPPLGSCRAVIDP